MSIKDEETTRRTRAWKRSMMAVLCLMVTSLLQVLKALHTHTHIHKSYIYEWDSSSSNTCNHCTTAPLHYYTTKPLQQCTTSLLHYYTTTTQLLHNYYYTTTLLHYYGTHFLPAWTAASTSPEVLQGTTHTHTHTQ